MLWNILPVVVHWVALWPHNCIKQGLCFLPAGEGIVTYYRSRVNQEQIERCRFSTVVVPINDVGTVMNIETDCNFKEKTLWKYDDNFKIIDQIRLAFRKNYLVFGYRKKITETLRNEPIY